jgi:uncharacterized membrane protein
VLARALVTASGLWVMAVVAAPLAVASSHLVLSRGAVGIYAAGARICHQRPERCFWIHGRPMPVCARCTGLYASAAIAAPLAWLFASSLSGLSRLSGHRARTIAALAALPTLITWGLEFAGVAHFSNVARAAAALPLGFAAAWLVVSALTPRAAARKARDGVECTDRMGTKSTAAERPRASAEPGRLALVCALAWLIPGAGHLLLGRRAKGLVFLVALPLMFTIGLWLQGRLFPLDWSDPLVFLGAIANRGIGAPYFIAHLMDAGAGTVIAASYEYGNTFLMTAGLLNFLVILDAFDVALGRK